MGFGLGLFAGSLLSIASDNMRWFDWTSFGWGPLAFLGFVCGGCLFLASLMPQSWTGKDWGWERRPMTARRYLAAKAGEDPGLRKELKANPRRTFDRELGSRLRLTVTNGFEITVLEETPTHEYIVL